MNRASTPLHTFSFSENPQTAFTEILVTYEQSNKIVLEKHKSDMQFRSETTAGVTTYYGYYRLTQNETNKFVAKVPVRIQLRYLTSAGLSNPSEISVIPVKEVLNDEVMENAV